MSTLAISRQSYFVVISTDKKGCGAAGCGADPWLAASSATSPIGGRDEQEQRILSGSCVSGDD